ncbi:hypothetical protein E1869_02385 [Salmonella enterica subsp. enterica serovar Kisangani]|nr:hypothetical protein [Salmonella enterica subsp. enterica serovar Kisangani]
MPYSPRIAQKSSEISDGKNNFKGGLSIKISYETWSARLRNFSIFFQAAISALLNRETELFFYDVDTDSWTRGMTKVTRKREDLEA